MKHVFIKKSTKLNLILFTGLFNFNGMEKEYFKTKQFNKITYVLEKDTKKIDALIKATNDDYKIIDFFLQEGFSDVENQKIYNNFTEYLQNKYKNSKDLNKDIKLTNVIKKNFQKLKTKIINNEYTNKDLEETLSDIITKTFIYNKINDENTTLNVVDLFRLISKFLKLESNQSVFKKIINNEEIEKLYINYKNKEYNDNLYFSLKSLGLYETLISIEEMSIKQKEFNNSLPNITKNNEVEIMNLKQKFIDETYDDTILVILGNTYELIAQKEIFQKYFEKEKIPERSNKIMGLKKKEKKESEEEEKIDEKKNKVEENSLLNVGEIEALIPYLETNGSLSKKIHDTSHSKNKYLSKKRKETILTKIEEESLDNKKFSKKKEEKSQNKKISHIKNKYLESLRSLSKKN
jgi:hypothetical protein